MNPTSRFFSGDADLRRMRDFLIAARADGSRHDYFHVGDLLWGMFQNTIFDPTQQVRLWEHADGQLLGFAWFYPPKAVSFQIHPRWCGKGLIEEQMLEWAEEHRYAQAQAGDEALTLTTNALEDDRQRIAFLKRHGFERTENHFLYMFQVLDRPLPEVHLPEGFTVRHITSEDEFAERVAIHREVWHPSKVTLDAYQRMRSVPGYMPELDLAAVAPDGTFASYCICWLDSTNKCGEFEPVGTRPAFRRQRLGRAVITEGLRRLKERGARTAIVYSYGANEASTKLYASTGFRTIHKDYDYQKQL
jgi:GNAT superfamily N-acetyltransferase